MTSLEIDSGIDRVRPLKLKLGTKLFRSLYMILKKSKSIYLQIDKIFFT